MKKTRVWGCLLLCAILLMTLAACGSKKSTVDDPPAGTTPVPEITPEPAIASVTAAPATAAPEATPEVTPEPTPSEPVKIDLVYENAVVTDLAFQTSTVFQLQAVTSDGSSGGSWTSSDASTASVDMLGVVTCYKTGTAKITYTQGDASATCIVTITQPTVRIFFGGQEKTDITLKNAWGFEIDLVAVVTPEGTPVTWTSDDATVASVNENGHVTAKRMGTTTVHAKCGTAEASCIVRVTEAPPNYAPVTPDPLDETPRVVIVFWGVPNTDFTITEGQRVQMNYILYNVQGNPGVTWSIQDPEYASVDEHGIVTGLKPTKLKDPLHPYTYLIATCGELKCECVVRVKEAEIS